MEDNYFVMFFMTKQGMRGNAERAACRPYGAAPPYGLPVQGAAVRVCCPRLARLMIRLAGMSVVSSLNSTGRSPSLHEQIATPGTRIQSL